MRGQLDSALVVAWLAQVALESVQRFSHIWRCDDVHCTFGTCSMTDKYVQRGPCADS